MQDQQQKLWFVGVGVDEEDGTTFTHVKSLPMRLWKNPKRGSYFPKRVLKTYMDMEKGCNPKIRLIHIFSERESAILDALVANAIAFSGPDGDFQIQEILERLVACGIIATDPNRFPEALLGPSPLIGW